MSKATASEIVAALQTLPADTRIGAILVERDGTIVADGAPLSDAPPAPSATSQANSAPTPAIGGAVEIWTDGACSGNPGPGGWAFCIVQNGRLIEEKGGYHPETTNNRMEMQALIEALNRLHPGATVTVKTDSQLIVNTITQGWKRKANRDLWSEIDAALDRHERVTFEHVKGHNGEEWNERVDRLAVGQYQACR